MTPERKKYLASISKEELIIRGGIEQYKARISNDKYAMNNFTYYVPTEFFKQEIRESKTIIKALKKQLPAPTKDTIDYCYCCPICNILVCEEYDNYCFKCGQKLR